MLDTYDTTRKSLIMTALGVFRVGIFVTLKTVKQLSLSDLQIALHVSFLILPAWESRVCPRLSEFKCHARTRAFVYLMCYLLI